MASAASTWPGIFSPKVIAECAAVVESGVGTTFSHEYRRGDTVMTFRMYLSSLEDGVVVTLSDVSELTNAVRRFEHLANTDSLTELTNRRHFLETAQREFARSARYERPISLLVLDIDHFKQVNDNHGHAGGDAVLKKVADALRMIAREQDVTARLGGEEFAVLVPETAAAGVAIFAERARDASEFRDRGERTGYSSDGEHWFYRTYASGTRHRSGTATRRHSTVHGEKRRSKLRAHARTNRGLKPWLRGLVRSPTGAGSL